MWSSDDELEVPDLEGKSTTTTHDTPSQSLQALILWQSAFKISSAAVTRIYQILYSCCWSSIRVLFDCCTTHTRKNAQAFRI